MKKLLVFLLAILLLSACQGSANVPVTGDSNDSVVQTLIAQDQTTPTPRPTLPPPPTATVTPLSPQAQSQDQAAAALKNYFSALEQGDVNAAAQQVSTFSLQAYNLTAADAASQLNILRSAGSRWSNLQVLDSKIFDAQTILVHVRYSLVSNQVTTAKDELWPMRLENSVWLYNWNNLVDFRTLTITPQTTAGVTVMPTQMRRFTDHLDLILLFQNHTNQPVVFGQANEVLATFKFGDQSVQANQAQIILDALRSKPDVTLTLTGYYTTYPDSVVIRQWKNYNVKPWYIFNLQ